MSPPGANRSVVAALTVRAARMAHRLPRQDRLARIKVSELNRQNPSMLTHAQIWTALDRLAARSGLSASGLAKKAGLDPTTFNRSKRITPDGRARWPSTESLAKALSATGTNIEAFVELITDNTRKPSRAIPVIGLAEAGSGGYFDDAGFPSGSGWDEIPFPAVNDEHAYALEISGDSMQPLYRDGDII